MKKTILTLAAVLWASFAYAQGPTPPVGIVIGTPVIGTCTNGYGISNNSGVIGCTAFGTGTGTVTSIGIGTGLSSTQSPLTTTGTLSVNFGTTSGTAAQGGVITAGGPTGSSSVIPVITWNAAGQLTAVSTASISVPTSANPSATIGLTAVNGTAGTFMTSDSAPALSQSIAPTWSNTHTFSSATPLSFTNTAPVVQLTSTGTFGWNNGTNTFSIRMDTGGSGRWTLGSLPAGNSLNVYLGQSGLGILVTGHGFAVSTAPQTTAADTFLTRQGAAVWQLGAANAASPVAQTLQFQGGSGTDIASPNATFIGALATGAGTNGDIIFKTGVKTTTGTTQATATTALTIKGETQAIAITGGTLGAGSSASFQSITGTWNDASTSFKGALLVNVTNTNSNSASLLLDLQRSGTSVFSVDRNGNFALNGGFLQNGIAEFDFFYNFNAISIRNSASYQWTNNATASSGADLFLTRGAAATLQLGAANAASPVNQTLQAQGSRSGTDTNVSGANLTITSGNGTGNSTGSSLVLKTPVAVASGTGAQTQTAGLTIQGGQAISTTYTVATLPTGITGGRAHVTDALTPVFGSTVVGGGAVTVPVFYNGSSWIVG